MSVGPDISCPTFYDVVRPLYEGYKNLRKPIDKQFHDSLDELHAEYRLNCAALTEVYNAEVNPLMEKYYAAYNSTKLLFNHSE